MKVNASAIPVVCSLRLLAEVQPAQGVDLEAV
jgi:hypothetical protein